MEETKNEQQIQIELTDAIAEGTYSNMTIISHSPQEFVLDFIRGLPGLPKAKVKARIVVSPEHAKRILKALNANIKAYETNFGVIVDKEIALMPANFGPTAQA